MGGCSGFPVWPVPGPPSQDGFVSLASQGQDVERPV